MKRVEIHITFSDRKDSLRRPSRYRVLDRDLSTVDNVILYCAGLARAYGELTGWAPKFIDETGEIPPAYIRF